MLIFSDVDGTLLADDGKSALEAAEWLEVARHHQVVLASSRDVDELRDVLAQLDLQGDLVAEDGAVIVERGRVERLGLARDALLQRVAASLPRAECELVLGAEPVAARGRLASILVPAPLATPGRRALLDRAGLALTPGGHWATITSRADKGAAARVLAARYGVTRWAAIGNAANDATLLRGAWQAFVIRNPEGHDPILAGIPGARMLTAPGPDGWREMLSHLDSLAGDAPEGEPA